jgi:hypothetical protein
MVPVSAIAMERTNNLSIFFKIICRYLNLVKNQAIFYGK